MEDDVVVEVDEVDEVGGSVVEVEFEFEFEVGDTEFEVEVAVVVWHVSPLGSHLVQRYATSV